MISVKWTLRLRRAAITRGRWIACDYGVTLLLRGSSVPSVTETILQSILGNFIDQRDKLAMKKQSGALLGVWVPLGRARGIVSWSWRILPIRLLLPIWMGLRRAISGVPIGIWLGRIWCSAVHGSAPRHDQVGESRIRGISTTRTDLALGRRVK